ncbi:MAG: type II secretion system protein GspG [Candidatus Brocadiales bacterium]|nr:type II secretion system protein GspG [Candidatus Brocadiales bacterium]
MKKFGGTGGFTLIEIVIVLAIIAVLAGILAPTLTRYVGDARTRKAEADTRNIAAAIGKFHSDTGLWPVWVSGTDTTADAAKKDILLSKTVELPDVGTTGWALNTSVIVDGILQQLIENKPSSQSANAYPTTGKRAWRGPYLERDEEDPWGHPYMVNVKFLQPANIEGTKPVFVLSAGPNKLVETNFEQTGPSLAVGGDDIIFRVK